MSFNGSGTTDVSASTAKESKKELSKLEKIACAAAGPVVGLFPPRVQVTNLGYEGACIASTSSRVFNGVWSVYAAASLVAKVFGVDIDPTTHNLITYFGIPVALDTVLREFLFGIHYYFNSPFSSDREPWGEPVISWIDASRNPKWYYSDV